MPTENMTRDAFIEALLKDRARFNDYIYTSLDEAVTELDLRWKDENLEKKISAYIDTDIPEVMKVEPKAVIFRQLVTPNYEIRRFMIIPDVLKIKPLFWEYHDDKFTSNNPIKHSLGKLPVHMGIGKKGGIKLNFKNVIEFNQSNGKKIHEVKTLWNQSLIDFHHEMLEKVFPGAEKYVFNASEWFHKNKGNAKDYYRNYVALFVRNGILFENFVLEGDELEFTRNIFLPAFIEAYEKTGKKPLIVALEPTEIEGDYFWVCHPPEALDFIEAKLKLV